MHRPNIATIKRYTGRVVWDAKLSQHESITRAYLCDYVTKSASDPDIGAIKSNAAWVNADGVMSDGQSISGVTKIRASDGMVLGTFGGGKSAYGLTYDGSNIWLASFGANAVTKIRATDGTTLATYPVTSPYDVIFDGVNVWVTSQQGVTKLRGNDGFRLGIFLSQNSFTGAGFDGANIWVFDITNNLAWKM
jgi:hypothetical protein